MNKANNVCPKCGAKLSPFYMKPSCPKCGVNLMYYKLDERLEQDAKNAAEEVRRVNEFTDMLRASTVKSPLLIIRLILFFTPLASMCLPMYRAGHKSVSLIGIILSIVNHGFDVSAWSRDYLFAVLAVVCVIVFSLAVIIASLFSAKKNGFKRNMAFSILNTVVFGALSLLVCFCGGMVMVGFYVTLAIYCAELILHCLTAEGRNKPEIIASAVLCVFICVACAVYPKPPRVFPVEDGGIEPCVVSFNLAAPWGTPFDGTSGKARKERFVDYMNYVCPVLIGTQELNAEWLDYINQRMPYYESYAVERGGDEEKNTSEMNGIFWRKNTFTAIEKNTFWLSQTPDTESRFTYVDENGEEQEAGCNRVCTYAILKDNKDGFLLVFLNTHLDNSSEEAQTYGAELIVKKIGEIKAQYGDIRIVLTGDFNQTDEGEGYKIITSVLNDTTDKSAQKATWQDWGYTNTGDKPIDFIFTDGSVRRYEILDDLSEDYVSDHYGIKAEIEW